MAAFTATLAFISAAATVDSAVQSRKASKKQKKARTLQRRIADRTAARSRRQQAREAIRQRASVQNLAAQTGTLGSSGADQGVANITAQESSNIAFIDSQNVLGQQLSIFNQEAADASSAAATSAAVAGVAGNFAGEEGYKELGSSVKSIFRR